MCFLELGLHTYTFNMAAYGDLDDISSSSSEDEDDVYVEEHNNYPRTEELHCL